MLRSVVRLFDMFDASHEQYWVAWKRQSSCTEPSSRCRHLSLYIFTFTASAATDTRTIPLFDAMTSSSSTEKAAAWILTKPGSPLEHLKKEIVDLPQPKGSQVLVKVHAAALNPGESSIVFADE